MTEQGELTYSEIMKALRGDKGIQDLLCSEKIIVMHQLWERGSALPKRLEVVHSKHPSPMYAAGQKYEFESGIYNKFLFDPLRQGYEVLLVHEVDGNLEWHVWHLKQYPIKR